MKQFLAILALGISLLSACAPVQAPAATSVPAEVLLPYSLRSMAFDGGQFWQVSHENGKPTLIAMHLTGKEISRTPVQGDVPLHRSLAWGQDKLWMLDENNTLRTLTPEGKLLATLNLSDLPETRTAEQIVWSSDELWLLDGAYLSPTGETVPVRFYRLDPQTGRILATLKTEDDAELKKLPRVIFSGFRHQNLAADAQAFYVARGNIFEKAQNAVYRIDRKTGLVSHKPLERIYTGLSTAFLRQGGYYAIELLDTSNCADACRGKLEKLPQP